ncbi:MAG: HAMP domain-containing histidine kinase [Acidobacteria bacterium]|nr:HAMP domain-containing histidine kinase [Acidobacteriota bacterium]
MQWRTAEPSRWVLALLLVVHDWLMRRDVQRIQELSEITRRICPHLSLFFAYRDLGPEEGGLPHAEVLIFRPGPDRWHMELNDDDVAGAEIPALVADLRQTPETYFYTTYANLDGDRHQVFIHRVDQMEKGEPSHPIGYYGFGIPTRVLAEDYFPVLLKKHLARLASTDGRMLESTPVAAIFDETGKPISGSGKVVPGAFAAREHLDRQSGVLPGWSIQAGFSDRALGRYARAQFLRGLGVTLTVTAVMVVAIIFIGMAAAREMRLSRAKSEFVANVSHELKTPLSLIRGFAETLHLNRLASPLDREEYFRIIETEILRLSMMIDKILEFSKIEVGIKSYHREMTDVAALADETLSHFTYELEKGGFTVERRYEEPHPLVPVDPQALTQALLNLLSNAVKYSDEQRYIGVKVASSNGHVEVSVSDKGIGVARSEQARIFEKFYRIGSGALAKTKGTGLGLTLVKNFAEANGGRVRVTSAPARGSTFTIVLPTATRDDMSD